MTNQSPTDNTGPSQRPYMIRALHEWCTDNGFTPYLAVFVDASVQVPMEYVKNHEIVLNISFESTSGLKLGNDFIEFKARFGGVARDIYVPVDHVVAIYARENGAGMAFPVPAPREDEPSTQPAALDEASAPRGLRLATSADEIADNAPAPTEAAPAAEAPAEPSGDDGDRPEPPRPAAGSRPALKRIK